MYRGRILVIGAGGFLGPELVRTLSAVHGEKAIIASDMDPEAGKLFAYCQFIPLNVFNSEHMERVFERYDIGQLYMLASTGYHNGDDYPLDTWQVNVDGLLQVLELSRKNNVNRLFWPSSHQVLRSEKTMVGSRKKDTGNLRNAYGISKLAGEHWCNYYAWEYGMDIRTVRYPHIVDPQSQKGTLDGDLYVHLYNSATKGRDCKCYLHPNERIHIMYIHDAVKAALDIMRTPRERLLRGHPYDLIGAFCTPEDIVKSIRRFFSGFKLDYVGESSISHFPANKKKEDDSLARKDWGWLPNYGLDYITEDMLRHFMGSAG